MSTPLNHTPDLIDVNQRQEGLWTTLLDSDLIPLRQDRGESQDHPHRDTLNRYMLVLMAFAATVIAMDGLFLGQLSTGLVLASVVTWFVLLATLLRQILASAMLLPPLLTLTATVMLVLAAVAQGATHHTLWLFPLLIAVSALLPTRVALLVGLLTLAGIVVLRGDNLATFDLAEDAALVATWLLSLSVIRLMTREADELTDMALTDPLTGAFNRRYLVPQSDRCIADFRRYARLSSLLLIDVDHFKKINDQFGHAMGDQVLRAIVRVIEDRLRGVDMVFRFGGEEFVVLMAEAGSRSAAKVAEELRETIQAQDLLPRREVTVSIGVCDLSSITTTDEWLQKVDTAMYQAKSDGRNRVVALHNDPIDVPRISSTLPIWR